MLLILQMGSVLMMLTMSHTPLLRAYPKRLSLRRKCTCAHLPSDLVVNAREIRVRLMT